MPHKRNPISAENISGLARVVRANSLAAQENIALWHERDISHSSVERIIIPDSTILIDYMLARFTKLVENLFVYPKNMLRNMELSRGLFHSETVMLALVEQGSPARRPIPSSGTPWRPGSMEAISVSACSATRTSGSILEGKRSTAVSTSPTRSGGSIISSRGSLTGRGEIPNNTKSQIITRIQMLISSTLVTL
jgi:hypothetical protein